MRPWIIQLGPWLYPTEAREELLAFATNRTPKQYVIAMWGLRRSESMRPRRSHIGWPETCFDKAKNGYVLRVEKPAKSNVTAIRRRTPAP